MPQAETASPVHYDVIWMVFKNVDDYCTLNHFWILNKYFHTHYMKRNAAYKHKFRILFHQLFTFLSLLPNTQLLENDVDFFTTVSCQCLEPYQRTELRQAIGFVYTLFKNFLIHELFRNHQTEYMRKSAPIIARVCLIQGPNYLDRYCHLRFNKQRVRIEAQNKQAAPVVNLRYLMGYCRSDTYRHLENQLRLFETFFVEYQ